MLGWDQFEFNKKRVGTCYTELVVLHLVGGAAHIVHFISSEARNIVALFSKIRWDRNGFHKNQVGARYAKLVFLHPVGSAGHVV
jgi:hypothetical protein